MVHSFTTHDGKITEHKDFKENAIWYDILQLKEEDRIGLEKRFKLYIPTKEKMGKIGTSDIFYKKENTLYMTTALVTKAHSDQPSLFPITFILNSKFLITLRYAEPKPFHTFKKRLQESGEQWKNHTDIFLGLLETIVDRIAELTEKIDLDMDVLSEDVFRARNHRHKRSQELDEILTRIGKKGDLTAKINESSRSVERLLNYFHLQHAAKESKEYTEQIHILQQDLVAILDHLTFLSHKIGFLLDASLGYITIAQNDIIKIFTVMAVFFLPPSLVAAIYGMNFKYIPEFNWAFGYLFALIIMLASAIVPYWYFKKKGWL